MPALSIVFRSLPFGAVLAIALAVASGLRVNTSASMPAGLWRVRPVSAPLSRGMIVSFCPAGTAMTVCGSFCRLTRPCSAPEGAFLKRIIAVTGDRVQVSDTGLSVNGRSIGGTRRLPIGEGWVIPAGFYSVGSGEIWVAATSHPGSLDSRYFGAVAANRILGIAEPLLIWRSSLMQRSNSFGKENVS